MTSDIVMHRPERLSRGVKAVVWAGGAVMVMMLLVLIAFGVAMRAQSKDVSRLEATGKTRTAQINDLVEQIDSLRAQLATKDRQIAALQADSARKDLLLKAAGIDPGPMVTPSSSVSPSVTVVPGPSMRVTPGPVVTVPAPQVTVVQPAPTVSPTPSPTPTALLGPLLCPLRLTC